MQNFFFSCKSDEENEKISSKDNWKNMLISLFIYYTANNKILIFVGFFPLNCIIIKYYTLKYMNVSGEKFTSLYTHVKSLPNAEQFITETFPSE